MKTTIYLIILIICICIAYNSGLNENPHRYKIPVTIEKTMMDEARDCAVNNKYLILDLRDRAFNGFNCVN